MNRPPRARSLAWQTDLIFARFDGTIDARDDHLRVRTPTNPTFWWGNYLLFSRAPVDADLPDWLAKFRAGIAAGQPESRHRAFGLDVDERVMLPPAFVAAGFTLSEATVLTLTVDQLRAPRKPAAPGFAFAPLDLSAQADAVVDKQVRVDAARYEAKGYRQFAARQMQRYAAMQRAGLGHWLGLRATDQGGAPLVASCGLFRDPARDDGLGRFQYVSTDPDWRRRGLCGTLVHAACRHGFDTMGLRTLVMVADPDDVAIGIYESLGFRRGASAWQVERPPLDTLRPPDAAESPDP